MEGKMRHLVVIALEFGTTNSECASSFRCDFKTDPLAIYTIHCQSQRAISDTTPTCLLMDKKKQFVAYGYDAEDRYVDLVDDNEQDDYYFFDRFTMSLHNNENVTRDMVLKDKTGKKCSAVEVFTLSIKYLVDNCMKNAIKTDAVVRDDDILWVLTVPAAWTDSGKQLMRESAEKAGLHAENVLLITEPEASYTYCHYIPKTRLQGSKPGIMIKEHGTKSMVVDLGGVTADITVLQQTYNGQLEELSKVTGNDCDDCGSISIDERFCKILEEIVGGNVITKVKGKNPNDWLDMLQEFRMQRKSVRISNTKVIRFRCPINFNVICKELHGHDLKSDIESSSYVNEITLKNDRFQLKADLMIKLLTPTIDSIITLMINTISNRSTNGVSNNVSNILMVGGLSECPMIQDAVYQAFPNNQIIIPREAEFSAVQGAVLFGHRPDYIWSELRDEEGIGK